MTECIHDSQRCHCPNCSESYARSNNIPPLYEMVTLMAREIPETINFMSDEDREFLINDLVENDVNSFSYDQLRDMFREGFGGYNNLSDMDIIDTHMSLFCQDLYEDSEFEGTVWHKIEQQLLKAKTIMMNKAIEESVLK